MSQHPRHSQVNENRRLHLQWLAAMGLGGCLLTACGGSGGDSDGGSTIEPTPDPEPTVNPFGLDLPAPNALQGELTWVAGAPWQAASDHCGGVDGAAAVALLGEVVAMAVAPDGRLYFAERPSTGYGCVNLSTRRLRVVEMDGSVRTLREWQLVGSGSPLEVNALAVSAAGEVFMAQGHPSGAYFATPGYPVYADGSAPSIWRVDQQGQASRIAGEAHSYRGGAADDGVGDAAVFVSLYGGMVLGADGLLYVNDAGRIRTVNMDGLVTTATLQGTLINSAAGRVLAWVYLADGTTGLADVQSGLTWTVQTRFATVDRSGSWTSDGLGGVYGQSDHAVQRMTSVGSFEWAVGVASGSANDVTQPGALPAQLGSVQAIAGGLNHGVYLASGGQIFKASFTT